MPLSSVVGAQSIVRPGVCTSSTRPASPYDGQVIYETDTDKTLVWNGTGWVFLSTSRANPGGLDFIKSQTIGSAVSSVTVSDVFSSTYDNYFVTVAGGALSVSNDSLQLKLGSTATGYYYASSFGQFAGGAGSTAAQNAAFFGFSSDGATNTLGGSFSLLGPNLAKNTIYQSTFVRLTTTGIAGFIGGYLADSTQYTAFTLTPGSGTMTGGTIRVYGYVNS